MQPILCFGEALIDFHPEGDDGRGFSRAYLPYAGGGQANVAAAVAILGGQARFAGMLGTDRFGDFLLDRLQQAGVDTRHVVRTDHAPTALAFVTLDAEGERSFVFYRPPSADMLFRTEHLQDAAFAESALLHVCSLSMSEPELAETTREAMRRARDANALVTFDLNHRPLRWSVDHDPRPVMWTALELADVIKLSAEEMDFLASEGEAVMLERLWHGNARLLVVTDGGAPLRWYARDTSGKLPSYRSKVVDSTAAGDAFVAGLAFRLVSQSIRPDGLDALVADPARMQDTLRFAAACGAITVTRKGSFSAMPTAAEVEALMGTHA
ncbi:carbohydrate kinase [Oleiagrimonas sp.]|jgi:fructokinase|uniref:carbohydrate kinase family protein n=1 Tax=Oleiagrimonas sp. TaxID=2010330 RepID=UPI00261A485A|nr:carbohydrate kinase [Oleiagrimonas sp.]MDA3914256.1 carbohydrate kinase [Oleiagrimonas sp.]